MKTTILICAEAEWRAVRKRLPGVKDSLTPFGEAFQEILKAPSGENLPVTFIHTGMGKTAAAAAAQYAIDHGTPDLIINLGTCGGIEGHVQTGDFLLAEQALIYDILSHTGEDSRISARYQTRLDLSWLKEPLPLDVRRCTLASGDRDLLPEQVEPLYSRHGAIAADWESGAIAWVATRNKTRCLILRGVSDLVSSSGGEVYGDLKLFRKRAVQILDRLVSSLPGWISQSKR